MKNFNRRFHCSLAIAILSVCALESARSQTYVELGDAGASLGSAQSTGAISGAGLTGISGTILGGSDGDFFYITINNPAAFSATTVGGSTLDTLLYLFTLSGNPILLNDDAPGGSGVQSTLPAGMFSSLAAGTYILGISLSGAEPINSGNQTLFADALFSTDVRGPRAGALGPVTGVLPATFAETGPYIISLTGAQTSAVPEPTTLTLVAGFGVGTLLLLRRRIRRS